jgi:hypothetical protein
VADKAKVEVDNVKAEVVGNVKAEAALAKAAPLLKLAADTSPSTGLLHIEVPLNRSEEMMAAVPVAGALVATKGKLVNRIATSQAIPKPRTFIPKAIDGSVTTPAGMTSVTIKTTHGNTDDSAVKLAATTFIASKAEAGTVSGSAVFTGASRHTTTTTPAIGCGTPTTSCCTTIQITLAGISRITLDSEPMPSSSISVRRYCLDGS